jgi:twinkle protein
MSAEFIKGDFMAVTARSLSEATCRKYGYSIGTDKSGRKCQIADYRDSDGIIVAQKLRYADKTFSVVGAGKKLPLFGQNLWAAGGKRLVITEGEIDALSVAQALGLSWPAVSIPNGADGAKRSVQHAYEYIESFEEVVFMFDMDEPGRAAALECAQILSPGKAKIAELPRKDANEMLKAGEVKALVSAVYQARVYRPDGIVSLDEIEERVLSTATMGAPWPFDGLTEATFGRQIGDVIGLGAGTGVGKTDLVTQVIMNDVMHLGKTCGVLYLEQGVGETGRRIAGKLAGKVFHVPDGSWTQAELVAAWGALKATGRLHLYDSFGAMDWATIKAKILYMIHSLGCEHIFLDHLTALAAAAEDERTALEKIMSEIASIAKDRCVFHYVSHLATPEGKSHEEGGRVSIRHFKGSRSIGFWSHQLYGLERNQQADTPEERSTTYLRCLKDRLTGRGTGKVFELKYDHATGLLSEHGEVEKLKEALDGNTDF